MTQRSSQSDAAQRSGSPGEPPSHDLSAFIRFCHRRSGAVWPELYDEMCGVAARREYRGWDHAELAARGLSFSLTDMPRLAGWVRAVLAELPEASESRSPIGPTPLSQPQPAVA